MISWGVLIAPQLQGAIRTLQSVDRQLAAAERPSISRISRYLPDNITVNDQRSDRLTFAKPAYARHLGKTWHLQDKPH
jgi:hypothetical protein